MSDWDFLHDMYNDGYSSTQISDAAACGYNPWEWSPMDEKLFSQIEPDVNTELVEIFENLVDSAASYYEITGRYLQIWGELGELYAEIKYGINRHKPHTRGSDGRLGDDLIEIKTISPEKESPQVQVKRAGNFNVLLVIRIDQSFNFEARFIERKKLSEGDGTYARVSWSHLNPSDEYPKK